MGTSEAGGEEEAVALNGSDEEPGYITVEVQEELKWRLKTFASSRKTTLRKLVNAWLGERLAREEDQGGSTED